MYEAIEEMYIEDSVELNCETTSDVIVGQLTYRVHHTTNQDFEPCYNSCDGENQRSFNVEYYCTITNVELVDESGEVQSDITDHIPTWFLHRLAATIEESAEEDNE